MAQSGSGSLDRWGGSKGPLRKNIHRSQHTRDPAPRATRWSDGVLDLDELPGEAELVRQFGGQGLHS
jgi:hypothetical protein